MLREGLRLGRRQQGWLYGSTAALFLSGALWLALERFFRIEGELGETAHPLQPWSLRLHGAAAMLFLAVLGSLVRGHVRLGWRLRLNTSSGVSLFAACLLLSLSGWALYYVSGESARRWASATHTTLGLALPLLLAVHALRGRTIRRRIAAGASGA
jgi:hypothetical protein